MTEPNKLVFFSFFSFFSFSDYHHHSKQCHMMHVTFRPEMMHCLRYESSIVGSARRSLFSETGSGGRTVLVDEVVLDELNGNGALSYATTSHNDELVLEPGAGDGPHELKDGLLYVRARLGRRLKEGHAPLLHT